MVTVRLDYFVLIFDIWAHCVAACSLYRECVSPGVGMVYGRGVRGREQQCWVSPDSVLAVSVCML